MQGKKTKHIFLLGLVLLISLFYAPVSKAEAVVSASKKSTTARALESFPHAEMEIVKQHGSTGNHAVFQKKYSSGSLPFAVIMELHMDVGDSWIRYSLLLQKNYLAHIYPFHAFW